MSNDIYSDMLKQPHLLIAGTTGSGKSVLLNGLICQAIAEGPHKTQLILVDPKRVELYSYKKLPHTIAYASEPEDMPAALDYAMAITDARFSSMQATGAREYAGGHIYVIIDELADLMTTQRRRVTPVIQRLCQVGRAAHVHVIAATQCPVAAIIPTPIKVNFDARVGLRTRSAQDSRNILDVKGCEELPRYGQAFYMTPEGLRKIDIPMIEDAEIQASVNHWTPKPETVAKREAPKPETVAEHETPKRKKQIRRIVAWIVWALIAVACLAYNTGIAFVYVWLSASCYAGHLLARTFKAMGFKTREERS